jgi:hypothetical protein
MLLRSNFLLLLPDASTIMLIDWLEKRKRLQLG